ncbi:perlucin-like protein [Mizuhopecten yessoensis]|uniref:perlucin-like protein n=1 Tax=Mizuhopecten yessoensis TaxID=6573 RepID=UPI000B45C94B|nr:perlucin-like protein [Mizuhopecten yessoensis]
MTQVKMESWNCLLLVLFALCVPGGLATCRKGWVTFEDTCYLFSHGKSSWGEAYSTCLALHSNLAVITSAEQQNFLISELTDKHRTDAWNVLYWIDGTDLEVENVWKWAISGEKLSYINWADGEPNNAQGGNCMNLYGNGGFKMADDDCELHLYYICQATNVEGSGVVIG